MRGQDDLEVYEFCSAYTVALVGRLSDKTLSDILTWRDSGPGGIRRFSMQECQCLTTRRIGRGYAKSRKVVPSQHEEDQTVFLPFPFVRHPSQPDSLEPTRRN